MDGGCGGCEDQGETPKSVRRRVCWSPPNFGSLGAGLRCAARVRFVAPGLGGGGRLRHRSNVNRGLQLVRTDRNGQPAGDDRSGRHPAFTGRLLRAQVSTSFSAASSHELDRGKEPAGSAGPSFQRHGPGPEEIPAWPVSNSGHVALRCADQTSRRIRSRSWPAVPTPARYRCRGRWGAASGRGPVPAPAGRASGGTRG